MNPDETAWSAFQDHVLTCPHCTRFGECPVGKQLGETWYRADQRSALQALQALDDGTVDRDDPAPWQPEL